MPEPNYLWRRLSPQQRQELLDYRREQRHPWHSPPHRPNFDRRSFLLTAACYGHQHHIGLSSERLDAFCRDLLSVITAQGAKTVAWCVLPNHYHVLTETDFIQNLLKELGRFHGRTSYRWNLEEGTAGRTVFYRCTERYMRSERHSWATLNYVHHNPVRHGYADVWTEWPWSSAREYLDQTGRDEAARIWRAYPIRDYGQKWDDPAM
jgi:putative transposase